MWLVNFKLKKWKFGLLLLLLLLLLFVIKFVKVIWKNLKYSSMEKKLYASLMINCNKTIGSILF